MISYLTPRMIFETLCILRCSFAQEAPIVVSETSILTMAAGQSYGISGSISKINGRARTRKNIFDGVHVVWRESPCTTTSGPVRAGEPTFPPAAAKPSAGNTGRLANSEEGALLSEMCPQRMSED